MACTAEKFGCIMKKRGERMKRKRTLWAGMGLCLLLSACTPVPAPVVSLPPVETPSPAPEPTPDPYSNDFAQVDVSGLDRGLIRVRYTGGGERRIKVQIAKDTKYNYDLAGDGSWESFTLTEGNGEYTLRVLEHRTENKYSPVFDCSVTLDLADDTAPFRESCQFVHFEEDSPVVELAGELCAGMEENGKKIQAVFNYVVENLSYDEEKRATVESGYLPDVDRILEEKKGICFDYAALMAAMLRSQGVACKLEVGNAGEVYHAWVEADMGEGQWKLLDPTFVSANQGNLTVLDFVSDPDNYKVRYYY